MRDLSAGGETVKKEVLTTFEASRYLNVAPKTVSNWIDAGHLKAYRTVGGHRRIRREDLEAFIAVQQSGRRVRPAARRRRVLVVESEPAVLEAILQILREAVPQYDLEAAHGGFEAGLKVAENAPDLVILDALIPGMKGGEMCRQIRSRPETRQARILALAPHPQPEAVEELLRQGANRCIAKPLDPAQLRREVTSLLGEG
jgi:excisionase family DNA binding protein